MSPFTADFFITTSRGYHKGASTLDYYGVVAVEPRLTSAKLLNVRVFWSDMRVFENMSRKKLASTLAIVSPGPSRVPTASLGRKNMVVDCHM